MVPTRKTGGSNGPSPKSYTRRPRRCAGWVRPRFVIRKPRRRTEAECRQAGLRNRERPRSGRNKIMRIAARAIIVTTGVFGLIGSALAADMTGADIKTFLSGKTAYLETTAASASG